MGEHAYSTKEILKFAISMEEEGVKFYEALAQKTKGEVREGLLSLADDEKRHKKIFSKWYEDADQEEADEYLFEETVDLFFRNYAKAKGFEKRESIPDSLEEAIDIGIETEKITIEYYKGLLEHIKSSAAEVLKKLIAEEEGHYNKLNSYKANIKK
ncbi:MAG: ferritin family protein [Epulopiscium sp.]|nr:ferritin family protein [Candidatus Epulonipiscium sp.]